MVSSRRSFSSRSPDDDAELRAYGAALRLLARRPLTAAELRLRLDARELPQAAIEAALLRLAEEGAVDDLQLALHYILVRSERLGHGRSRLLRELRRRGVEPELAERAWRKALDENALRPEDSLRRLSRRQLERCGGRLDPRQYRRVYNALCRAGHDASSITEVLAPYRAFDADDS